MFTQKPESPLYFLKGSDAVFEWHYSADNSAADLKLTIWRVYNKTERNYYPLLVEFHNCAVLLNPNIPPSYEGRVQKIGQATLVIKRISFEDSTRFKCSLEGKQGILHESSSELVVTGIQCSKIQ